MMLLLYFHSLAKMISNVTMERNILNIAMIIRTQRYTYVGLYCFVRSCTVKLIKGIAMAMSGKV